MRVPTLDGTILPTSAFGPMSWTGSAACAGAAVFLVAGSMSEPATASSYRSYVPFERTAAGPTGKIASSSIQSTAEAVLEIRRISGLTWEELAELFDVSRRSVHHWASGNAISAKHEHAVRQVLIAVRHLDRGSAANTRSALLTPDAFGVSLIELLKVGSYREAMSRLQAVSKANQQLLPLTKAAHETRRPPAPEFLVGADQERPNIPAKARIARAVRAPKLD